MSNKELDEKMREAFEAIRKLSETVNEVSKSVSETSRRVNKLTDSWGRFVEGIVEPSVVKFLENKGLEIRGRHPRMKRSKDGRNAEYDLVVICPKVILLVQATAHVSSKDVDELIKDLKDFFFFVSEYKGYKLMGAIAGMSYGRGTEVYALRKGLYVLKASGEIMEIIEPRSVKIFT